MLTKLSFKQISIISKLFILINLILFFGSILFDSSKHNDIVNSEIYLIFLWLTGILNFIFTLLFLIKIRAKKVFIFILIISGIIVLFPFFLITLFGIPFLITYFIVSLYFHFQKSNKLLNKSTIKHFRK